MNQYQRLGTFIVRLTGALVALFGALGELYALAVGAGLMQAAPSRPPSILGSAIWLIGGALLVVTSRGLGRWLGRGLD